MLRACANPSRAGSPSKHGAVEVSATQNRTRPRDARTQPSRGTWGTDQMKQLRSCPRHSQGGLGSTLVLRNTLGATAGGRDDSKSGAGDPATPPSGPDLVTVPRTARVSCSLAAGDEEVHIARRALLISYE